MMEKIISIILPFGNFAEFNSWNDYMSLYVLKDFLHKHSLKANTLDLSKEFSKKIQKEEFRQERLQELDKKIQYTEQLAHVENLDKYIREKTFQQLIKNSSQDEFNKKISQNKQIYQELIETINPEAEQGIVAKKKLKKIYTKILAKKQINNIVTLTIPSKNHYQSGLAICELIKEKKPETTIILGGSFIKLLDEEQKQSILQEKKADFVLQGDEDELVETILLLNGEKHCSITSPINELVSVFQPSKKMTKLIVSKGCYWNKCHYCDYTNLNTRYQLKSIKIIVEEIEKWYGKGRKHFELITDALHPNYAKKIATQLLEKNIHITWTTHFIRIEKEWTPETIKLLKKTGFDFSKVSVGLDVYAEKALALVEKGYTQETIKSFFDALKESDTPIGRVNVIPNIPGTTIDTFKKLKQFLLHYIDQYTNIAIFPFILTDTCKIGKNPKRYGLTPTTKPENTDYQEHNYTSKWLNEEENKQIIQSANHVRLLTKIKLRYPYTNKKKIANIKLYQEEKQKITVTAQEETITIKCLFDKEGNRLKKGKNIIIPKWFFPNEQIIKYQKIINCINEKRKVSIQEISELLEPKKKFEQIKLQQIIFHSFLLLAGKGYFETIELTE